MRLSQLPIYLRRRLRAAKLGIPLPLTAVGRIRDFVAHPPSTMRLFGRRVPISLPSEVGVIHALIEVLLEDGYSLRDAQRPVRTVLDIGANVGIFCLAAREAFPDSVIHAYEPNPGVRPHLNVQAEVAGARIYAEAIQLSDGRVSLEVHRESVGTRTRHDTEGEITATAFQTAVRRLGGTVDFLKMDCEGAEWEILRDRAAWAGIRQLALEYHCDRTFAGADASRLIQDLGFKITRHARLTPSTGIIHALR